MNIDVIPAGPDSKFIERWADRKARIAAKNCASSNGPKPKRVIRYPQAVRDAAVAAYGKKSMTVIAAELGVSTGAVSHWWAQARRDGTIKSLFGRFNGARVRYGRVSKSGVEGSLRIEPAVSRDALKAHRRDQRRLDAPAARATGGEALS